METQEEDLGDSVGGYAPALHFCPHAEANILPLPYGTETKDIEPDDNQCVECDNTIENWLCLTCHTIRCGRFARAHARKHWEQSGHCIALGFGDLSFWCYACESYLHHLTMRPVYSMYSVLHVLKFGEETVEVTEFTQPNVFTIAEEAGQRGQQQQRRSISLAALPTTDDKGADEYNADSKHKEPEEQ